MFDAPVTSECSEWQAATSNHLVIEDSGNPEVATGLGWTVSSAQLICPGNVRIRMIIAFKRTNVMKGASAIDSPLGSRNRARGGLLREQYGGDD